MEKKDNSDKLKALIKSLVQEELKNSSKEIAKLIKEQIRIQVKQQVNEILAEQFLKTISTPGPLSAQMLGEQLNGPKKAEKRPTEAEKNKFRQKYEEKMRNLGVLGTDAQELFEGLENSGPRISSTTSATAGAFVDDDGAGVDLSVFGL